MQLGYSRKEFLNSCPREITALWDIHVKFNGWNKKAEEEEEVMTPDECPFL
ncbi:hypothetical protein KYB31_03955 [Clostridium felsineum]|uniref:hypothetical protein n=1 Tax=Clostridium felsineum TaxID=36839 RepID=UPI00214D6C3C|nr:hypothetical protein [Clostridium felsineum]MCR3758151.1 hypothetical protein [Clostridium felsineum]